MLFNLDPDVGYPEIGALLSGVLFGIFTMQVYIYHKNFPNDPGWIKFGLVIMFSNLNDKLPTFYAGR